MTSCIKLRNGLFLVEWKIANLHTAGGRTDLLFEHGAVSKAYTLKCRNDLKHSLLEITVLPKEPVKTIKRSYHSAFPSNESTSSEDSTSSFSSVSYHEEISDSNIENDSSDDADMVSNLRDVLDYRSADSDDLDELYEPYTDTDTIEDTDSDDQNEQHHLEEDDNFTIEGENQITAQGNGNVRQLSL